MYSVYCIHVAAILHCQQHSFARLMQRYVIITTTGFRCGQLHQQLMQSHGLYSHGNCRPWSSLPVISCMLPKDFLSWEEHWKYPAKRPQAVSSHLHSHLHSLENFRVLNCTSRSNPKVMCKAVEFLWPCGWECRQQKCNYTMYRWWTISCQLHQLSKVLKNSISWVSWTRLQKTPAIPSLQRRTWQ